MKRKQIANVLNDVFAETIGEEAQFKEDLSNFVSVGEKALDSIDFSDNKAVESVYGKLINKIGKTIIEADEYKAKDWGIYKDSWEYGSILEKIRVETGEFHENPVWNLQDYEPSVWDYESADANVKFFNSGVTYESILCTTSKQLKESFQSEAKMNAFLSALETRVKSKMEFSKEQLARRTITNLIAEKLKTSKNIVPLLTLYNTKTGKTATASTAAYDRDFLEFLTRTLKSYSKYMSEFSVKYNNDEYATFTPQSRLRTIIQTEFVTGLSTTLPANTYNEEFLNNTGLQEINYWQSPDHQFKINVVPASEGPAPDGEEEDERTVITQDNILGVMFDDRACMITNAEPYTDSIYNPEGRFFKTWYRYDASYFNDIDENAIVFVLQ